MHRLFLVPALLFSLSGQAQTALHIKTPTALVLQAGLEGDTSAQAGMQAAGLNPEVIARTVQNSAPERWPIGLRTDSARSANLAAVSNYVAYLVCEYASPVGALTIVNIPTTGNFHMPEDMRSVEDLTLVFPSDAVEAIDTWATRPAPSRGPVWRNLRTAKIIKPDDVFATYDLSDDPEALAALEKQGLNQSEIEAVVFRSHERNWPEGIAEFDKRYPLLPLFKKYKAYRLARWADKVLVVVPTEANKRAEEGMRPYLDIYMVFNATAVQVKDKEK